MDAVTEKWFIEVLRHLEDHNGFPNLVDLIATDNGWLPLEAGEKMTVHYHNKEYVIYRVNDSNRQREPQAERAEGKDLR